MILFRNRKQFNPTRLLAESGVNLFQPRQNEHQLSSIVGVDFLRVVRFGPEGVVFEVDGLEGLEGSQMVYVLPAADLIVVHLSTRQH